MESFFGKPHKPPIETACILRASSTLCGGHIQRLCMVHVNLFIFSYRKKVFAHGREVSWPSTCRLGRARVNRWSSVASTVRHDKAELTDRVTTLEMDFSCHVLVDGEGCSTFQAEEVADTGQRSVARVGGVSARVRIWVGSRVSEKANSPLEDAGGENGKRWTR